MIPYTGEYIGHNSAQCWVYTVDLILEKNAIVKQCGNNGRNQILSL